LNKPIAQTEDSQPKFCYAGANGRENKSPGTQVKREKREFSAQHKSKIQDAKTMFSRVVEALDHEDIAEALAYKIPADILLTQLKTLVEN